MSIKKKAFHGLSWNLVGRSGQQFIRILSDVVLARMLSPDDFGVVGVALAVIHLTKLPASFGIASTIVQLRDTRQTVLSSAFYFNIAVAVLLFSLIQFAIGPFADWYQKPALEMVTRWASWIIPLYALNIVQAALQRKAMNFKKLSIVGITSEFLGALTGVLAVLYGWGMMSLVVKHVVSEFTSVCMLWWRPSWLPKAHFELQELRSLLSVGVYVFFAQSTDVILTRLSVLTVGGVYGTTTLGLMNKADSLSNLVTNYVSNSFKEVSFAGLSSLQETSDRFVNALTQLLKAVNFLAFGLAGTLFFAGADIIPIVLGNQWTEAVPIFQVLVFLSPVAASDGILSFAFVASNRSKEYFRFDLVKKSLTVIPIVLALAVSFEDFLLLLVVVSGLKLLVNHSVISAQLGILMKNRIRSFLPYLLISLACGFITYFSLNSIGNAMFSHLGRGFVFFVLYATTNLMFRTSGWIMFIEVLRPFINRRLGTP